MLANLARQLYVSKQAYLDGLDLELKSGVLVNDNHGMGVQLQAGQGPHMVHTLLDAALQGQRLALAKNNDDNLAGFEDGLNTDSQGHARHLVNVVIEEARVGQDGVVG